MIRQRSPGKSRMSVAITPELRCRLEEAREHSGRSLTDEVEAQLRRALDGPRDAGEMLVLHVDDGLMAWLRAAAAISMWSPDLNAFCVFTLREEIVKLSSNAHERQAMIPHLPEPLRAVIQGWHDRAAN